MHLLNSQHFYLMRKYVNNTLVPKGSNGIQIAPKVFHYNLTLLAARCILIPSVDGAKYGIHQKNLPVRRLQAM